MNPNELAAAVLQLDAAELENFLRCLATALHCSASEIVEQSDAPTPLTAAASLVGQAADVWATRSGN